MFRTIRNFLGIRDEGAPDYRIIPTRMVDKEALVRALHTYVSDDFPRPTVYSEPVSLRDKHFKTLNQTAEIIHHAPHNHTSSLQHDMGFKRQPDGTFALIIAEQDLWQRGRNLVERIESSYHFCLLAMTTVTPEIEKILRDSGYFRKEYTLEQYVETAAHGGGERSYSFLATMLTHDVPHHIQNRARQHLEYDWKHHLASKVVARLWLESRHPVLEELLRQKGVDITHPPRLQAYTTLKFIPRKAPFLDTSLRKHIAEALGDADREISNTALEYFIKRGDAPPLNDFVTAWWRNRNPQLLELLKTMPEMPGKMTNGGVYLYLKLGHDLEWLHNLSEKRVIWLAEATRDADPEIADRAKQVLRDLKKKAAREELVRLTIEGDYPLALDSVLSAGYEPKEAGRKALLYFMAEQWDKYETLDFDHRLLRAYYETADANVRRRIAAKVRDAGRSEYLTAITGGENRTRAAELSAEEAEILVQVLIANKQWERLWQLVFDLPLKWSAYAVRELRINRWKPAHEADKSMFEELYKLAMQPMTVAPADIEKRLTPAVRRAQLRVSGRVNAIAFHPQRPLVAVGAGNGTVTVWNMQTAQRELYLRNFEHSVGTVAYTPDGKLLIGETSNEKGALCSVYLLEGENARKLYTHHGPVTALAGLADNMIFSTGRSGTLVTCSLDDNEQVNRVAVDAYSGDWARGVCFSRDRRKIALLHKKISIMRLPDLYREKTSRNNLPAVVEHAVFTPDGKFIVAGQNNGELLLCLNERKVGQRYVDKPELLPKLSRAGQAVEGLALLYEHDTLICASADGQLNFYNWTRQENVGQAHAPGSRLISMTVSADGAFMATGDSDSSFSLWDLRALELRRFFGLPLAQGKPIHLAAIAALHELKPELNASVATALDFIEIVLRHRFRYDVEIGEVSSIQAGDFDIEIEG
jgi:hypothetical protein